MAFQAKEDYPDIVFTNSVMVGNSRSDIEFGNKLGMYTILVGDKYPKEDKIYNKTCAYFPNLYEFALSL
ncbi:MAG: HAD hydrolase-like protein [Dysgonomonas sp.]